MSDHLDVSRRGFLPASARMAGFTAAVGIAPQFIRPGRAFAADALAPGMIGGPTGFDGAERYQYGADTPEGRAIEAAKSLKAAGKAPERIVLGLSDGSIGQLTQPFPKGAPSIKDLWEKETGIKLEIVGVPNGQEFTKTMQDISTKGGAFDIYAVEWNRLGDLAETGGIIKLDDYVTTHKPEWDDPERGYVDRHSRACRCSTSIMGPPMACRSMATSRPGTTAPTFSMMRPKRRPFPTNTAMNLHRPRHGRNMRYRRLLPPSGQGPFRLHRPAQPGLGLYQLVSALCDDGQSEPVPVR